MEGGIMKLRAMRLVWSVSLALVVASLLGIQTFAQKEKERESERHQKAGWVAGDFHQHTTYTDGSNSFKTVMDKNNQFGLDWWANSEHGGAFATDARGPLATAEPYNVNGGYAWTDATRYPLNPILPVTVPALTKMWRWQSIRDYSFDDVLDARALYQKPILQSYEWNVPGHEHCSLGLITGQFRWFPTAEAIAQFEYLFDANDKDVDGGLVQGWTGKILTNDHAKAVAAVAWLQANYRNSSYAVFAHPERKGPASKGGYDINHFRDLNNAAPDVAFGFESMPGHQKEPGRGGYGLGAYGGTFGGVGVYAATVGGLWDAMLGEGRHWWLFASSDFHNTEGDFWPGEYQKTYTFVSDKRDPRAIIDGLRSGNSFVVMGDLIEALEFSAQYGSEKATMGETLPVERKRGTGNTVKITIKFKSPTVNNNGDRVVVDHVDLIAGEVTGKVRPGTPGYTVATNPTTGVIKTLNRDDFRIDRDGYFVAHVFLRLDRDMYFRLRGTNVAPGTENETDGLGNPLADSLMGPNTPAKAWADLWFYSNPIFVNLK
jgi:hypothetical protein